MLNTLWIVGVVIFGAIGILTGATLIMAVIIFCAVAIAESGYWCKFFGHWPVHLSQDSRKYNSGSFGCLICCKWEYKYDTNKALATPKDPFLCRLIGHKGSAAHCPRCAKNVYMK